MFNIEKFKEELSKYGLTLETYDKIITDIDSKIDGENDYDWSEIKNKYGINCNSDTIRKSSSTPFGGKMRSEYEKYKAGLNQNVSENSELDVAKFFSCSVKYREGFLFTLFAIKVSIL